MNERLWKVWRDPVVSAVIAGLIVSESPKIVGSHTTWWPSFTSSYPVPLWLTILVFAVAAGSIVFIIRRHQLEVSKIEQTITMGDPTKLTYPLKCYVNFCNNSARPVEVRIGDYKANKVTLRKFEPNVLQVKLRDWSPTPDGADRIAVLSGQMFRLWIGIDEKAFTDTRVRDLTGQIGTVSLRVEGKKLSFDL